MFFLNIRCAPEEKDILIANLWERGSTGIVEGDLPGGWCSLRAYFDNDADASALSGEFNAKSEAAENLDWIEIARERLQPMIVGARFFLVPEWRGDPTPPGRFRIAINSGLAFGTGAHETTRLALELVEEYVKPGMIFADVGAGSGILSEAAAHMGAALVVACDVDATAVEVAVRNFRRAGIKALAFTGSANALRSDSSDAITANITPEWIVALAPEWMRVLRPGGFAILSGFEASDVDRVSRALLQAGARIAEIRSEAEWRAVVAYRRGTA
ncbi:MAG: 50S ribosomal protein L11 methyltransferase [Acidobacteriota bacterium]|nr:50S ribosomal protein L11 methyltransferase [Acidobacteriota bacterium]